MNKQEWELIHEHFISMIKMSMDDITFFKELIIRHPGDPLYKSFNDTLKLLKNELKLLRKEYKDFYGFFPKM